MSLYDRSAQFASYKALSGYEDMIGEEARLTDRKIELEEADLDIINQKLNLINDAIQDGEHPEVSFLCFVADSRKSGGAYRTVTDRVKRIDPVENKVILCSTRASGVNEFIQIEDIFDIQGNFVDNMDSD